MPIFEIWVFIYNFFKLRNNYDTALPNFYSSKYRNYKIYISFLSIISYTCMIIIIIIQLYRFCMPLTPTIVSLGSLSIILYNFIFIKINFQAFWSYILLEIESNRIFNLYNTFLPIFFQSLNSTSSSLSIARSSNQCNIFNFQDLASLYL